jgi:hypothetical protein
MAVSNTNHCQPGVIAWLNGRRKEKTYMAMTDTSAAAFEQEDFASLLEESYGGSDALEGTVVKGKVIGIEKDLAVIDVGLKTEGRVPLKEFGASSQGWPEDRRRSGSLS